VGQPALGYLYNAIPAVPLSPRQKIAVEFPMLATAAIEALDKINITDKVSDEVAGLIRKRCGRAREEFRT
jgi:hypothetical protein